MLPVKDAVTVVGINREYGKCRFYEEVEMSRPDVLLVGIKQTSMNLINELEKVKSSYPEMGIIILLNQYTDMELDRLRKIVLSGSNGMALFMRLSLESLDYLVQTVSAVGEGQVILDPQLAASLFVAKSENRLLGQLTARELEILGLLSMGYTNSAIADELFIDIKTVEHHMNSIYGKLKTDPGYHAKHLRVSAARLYLENMGPAGIKSAGATVQNQIPQSIEI